jgi:hypothetical protein
MKNRIVGVFGMVAILLTLTSCSSIMIDEDVVASWENVPVEELDTHSFFITIPMIKTVSDGGVEIRNYRNGKPFQQCSGGGRLWGSGYISYSAFSTCLGNEVVCNNLFYIKDGLVKEYRLTGRCRTAESLRPESNSF